MTRLSAIVETRQPSERANKEVEMTSKKPRKDETSQGGEQGSNEILEYIKYQERVRKEEREEKERAREEKERIRREEREDKERERQREEKERIRKWEAEEQERKWQAERELMQQQFTVLLQKADDREKIHHQERVELQEQIWTTRIGESGACERSFHSWSR